MKSAFLFLLGSTFVLGADPQPLLPPLVMYSGNLRIVIPQRNAEGPRDFHSYSCSGTTEYSVLHAAIRRGETLYVVFTSAGWSRGPNSHAGHCGAGWERQINWIVIRRGIVLDHQRRDIDSCWRDSFGGIDGWRRGSLYWTTDEREGAYTCLFDSNYPQAGIQIREFNAHPNP